jgi:hypothetical protein
VAVTPAPLRLRAPGLTRRGFAFPCALAQYESCNPRWRELAAWHVEELAARGRAERQAGDLDKTMGAVMARVARR